VAVVDQSSVDVPLSLFSSLNTELSPPDIPEGVSPDNSDVIYLPGSVSTRPGLQRVFVAALIASGMIVYQKSYVQPTGIPQNLYFTSDGSLWLEQVAISPGTATLLYFSTATMASSVTAFGREYIALSDGVHGADIPLQWDGSHLWRVTQDGPGAPPTVVSVALPSSQMTTAFVPGAVAVTAIATVDLVTHGTTSYYSSLLVTLASTASFVPGQGITIAGNTNGLFNATWGVSSILNGTQLKLFSNFSTAQAGTGGTATVGGSGNTLIRANNIVTSNTATPHGLQIGYQAQITNVPASVVGGVISSIVLNNEAQAGIAIVTTSVPHGLLPNNIINISGVTPTTVGGGITNISLSGDVVTVTMASAHGLQIGSVVNVTPVTNSKLAGQWYVTTVPTPTTFTYAFIDTDIASGADTGTVTYIWPLANANPQLNYFTVLTAPTATTFTIALSYTDGTWSGGSISFAWNGIFFVTDVISPTQFQYQQYGPNSTTTSVGTVTPYGQMTPGLHQVQQCFLLDSGAITAPSPPATFIANGGQYPSVSNLAIGPSNVAGRILLFTGAGGAYFFYIPQAAQVNGLIVSTATQINDNTTTSILLDFSDNTLYAATGCSIPGNNLAAQVVLGPCAGFFTYASRLQAWGERNKVQNFLNMGFDGGLLFPTNTPLGWTYTPAASSGSCVASIVPGFFYQIISSGGISGQISQPAFEDAYGNPILLPNTQYDFRVKIGWETGTNGQLVMQIYSPTVGLLSQTVITVPNVSTGSPFQYRWFESTFSALTPETIPPDTEIILLWQNATSGLRLNLKDCEFIYTDQPYLQNQERVSYIDNPEGFDGLTGVLGPEDDETPIMNHGVIRNTLYIVTGNAVHEASDNKSTEPSGWDVEEVDDECGAWSIASVARNPQGIGSAGKGFMAWSGPDGAHVFTGRNPEKCSQEIQSLWDPLDILPNLVQFCWTKNDQKNKRIYFGIPVAVGQMQVLVLDYRNLATEQIGSLPPVHISFTGKMIASDLTRKWTKWTVNAFCGELMYRGGSNPVMCFGGVNNAGGSQSYTLNPAKYSDDDFGLIPAYYTTYFFVSHEAEAALQLGSHRKQYDYLTMFIPSIGTVAATPYMCSLSNPLPATPNLAQTQPPGADIEIGINVITSRCAFRISAAPFLGTTDSYFSLQKMVVNMKRAPWQPVRGSNSGTS
jgi:hypothetical protein